MKRGDGQLSWPAISLVRQRGTHIHPRRQRGQRVSDDSPARLKTGKVKFERLGKDRKQVSIIEEIGSKLAALLKGSNARRSGAFSCVTKIGKRPGGATSPAFVDTAKIIVVSPARQRATEPCPSTGKDGRGD